MGILNVTPDSFSDGGKYTDVEAAFLHAMQMISEGADIIDIGGESTKPGYTPVSADEQIERVIPVIERIRKESDIPISVDTTSAVVARQALGEGCDLINDIWGLKKDPALAPFLAEVNIPCVIMHNRDNTDYANLLEDVLSELKAACDNALNAGVKKEQIIVDPGIGFGKTPDQNLEVLRNLGRFRELGYPVLLGTSRKSVIGVTLNLPVSERLEGTLVTTVMGVISGCGIVRVHDVKENVRAIKMTEAILGK